MKKTTILTAVLMAGTAFGALAHSGATGIVKERMDAMLAMGKAVKAVAPMMRGEVAYDADALRQTARTFQEHAGEAMTTLFPEGSGGMPSEAKPSVWTDAEGFAELAEELAVYAKGLEGAAENGLSTEDEDSSASGASMMGGGSMMGEGNTSSSMMGDTGGSSMMGNSNADAEREKMLTVEDIAALPVDTAFNMTAQVCSACHSRYRAEDN